MFHVLHILINDLHIMYLFLWCCITLAHIFGLCDDDVSVRRNSRQTKISLKALGHESPQVSLSQSEARFKAPQPIRGRGSLVRAVRPAHSESIIADVGNIWSMHMTRNDGICA